MSMLEIEMDASKSELTAEDYTSCIWIWALNKKNKKALNKLARELNVFPAPANVYEAVCAELFKGIAI